MRVWAHFFVTLLSWLPFLGSGEKKWLKTWPEAHVFEEITAGSRVCNGDQIRDQSRIIQPFPFISQTVPLLDIHPVWRRCMVDLPSKEGSNVLFPCQFQVLKTHYRRSRKLLEGVTLTQGSRNKTYYRRPLTRGIHPGETSQLRTNSPTDPPSCSRLFATLHFHCSYHTRMARTKEESLPPVGYYIHEGKGACVNLSTQVQVATKIPMQYDWRRGVRDL